jgi:hypothetical protein
MFCSEVTFFFFFFDDYFIETMSQVNMFFLYIKIWVLGIWRYPSRIFSLVSLLFPCCGEMMKKLKTNTACSIMRLVTLTTNLTIFHCVCAPFKVITNGPTACMLTFHA